MPFKFHKPVSKTYRPNNDIFFLLIAFGFPFLIPYTSNAFTDMYGGDSIFAGKSALKCVLKIIWSVKTPWHRPSMEVACCGPLIHGFSCHSFKFLWKTVNSKPPTIPFRIVACTFSDNLSRNSSILQLLIFIPSNLVFFLDTTFSIKNCNISTDLYVKPTDTHQYLLSSSCHPFHTKRSITYSLGQDSTPSPHLPRRYYIQNTLCELGEQLQNHKQSQVQREITRAQRVTQDQLTRLSRPYNPAAYNKNVAMASHS